MTKANSKGYLPPRDNVQRAERRLMGLCGECGWLDSVHHQDCERRPQWFIAKVKQQLANDIRTDIDRQLMEILCEEKMDQG